MNPSIGVIIPTFINPHLFWIIEKKNLPIRNAINKAMNSAKKYINVSLEQWSANKIYCAKVDDKWVRVSINENLTKKMEETQTFVCWLLDYGIMRQIECLYELPEKLSKCPALARKASLYNVVNLSLELNLASFDPSLMQVHRKTTQHITGVAKFASNLLELSQKLYFKVEDENFDMFFGDIIAINEDEEEISLTKKLIADRLMEVDPIMFSEIYDRKQWQKEYFQNMQSWNGELDKAEIFDKKEILFNTEMNDIHMEYFKRTANERNKFVEDENVGTNVDCDLNKKMKYNNDIVWNRKKGNRHHDSWSSSSDDSFTSSVYF